jgi:hypothetical protein
VTLYNGPLAYDDSGYKYDGSAVSGGGIAATGAGSITITGAATAAPSYSATAAGSLALNGAGTAAENISVTGSGSLTITGASTAVPSYALTGSGSLTVNGAATTSESFAATGAGSLALNGAATASTSGAYSATGAGSLTVTGAGTVTVSYAGTGSGTLAINGVVNPRTNLVTNPSVETNLAGWSGNFYSSAVQSSTQAFAGTQSYFMTATGTGLLQAWIGRYAVTAGLVYTASGYIRDVNTAVQWRLQLDWFDSGGAYISTTGGTTVTVNSTGWVRSSATGNAPSNAVTVNIVVATVAIPTAVDTIWTAKVLA